MTARSDNMKPVKLVGAVAQSFRIMRTLAASRQPMGVSAIAREAGVNPSTAFNILRTLVLEEAVEFDDLTKSYVLGAGLLRLCDSLLEKSIEAEIRGELERIADESNCLVGLWQASEGRMVLVERAVSKRPMRLDMAIKQRLPPLAGSVGRAYAAAKGLSTRELKAGFKKLRWEGPLSVDQYIEEVREAEQRGYAIDDEALYPGVVSVGTVIHGRDGEVIYGLSASDIAHHLDAERVEKLGEEMRRLARIYSLNP